MARKVLHVRLGGGEVPANGTSVRSAGPGRVPSGPTLPIPLTRRRLGARTEPERCPADAGAFIRGTACRRLRF